MSLATLFIHLPGTIGYLTTNCKNIICTTREPVPVGWRNLCQYHHNCSFFKNQTIQQNKMLELLCFRIVFANSPSLSTETNAHCDDDDKQYEDQDGRCVEPDVKSIHLNSQAKSHCFQPDHTCSHPAVIRIIGEKRSSQE